MTPTLRFDLQIEPTTFSWNGRTYTLSGLVELLPDEQVKHLHKRVIGVAKDDRRKIPFVGRVIGRARQTYENSHNHCYYLVEDETTGIIERVTQVQEVDG